MRLLIPITFDDGDHSNENQSDENRDHSKGNQRNENRDHSNGNQSNEQIDHSNENQSNRKETSPTGINQMKQEITSMRIK